MIGEFRRRGNKWIDPAVLDVLRSNLSRGTFRVKRPPSYRPGSKGNEWRVMADCHRGIADFWLRNGDMARGQAALTIAEAFDIAARTASGQEDVL